MIEEGCTEGEEGRRVKKRLLVIKCNENDNIPYCGEYLSVNSG